MSQFFEIHIDPALIARARRGDHAAYHDIYQCLAKPVYTLIRRLVVRPAVAEELLQDVFVELLRGIDAYNGSGSFAGWVRSIAVTRALMHLRSPWHRRLLWLSPELAAPLSAAEVVRTEELPQALERALERLSPTTRSVVWLYDVEGYTHEEIARLHGRSISFSKSQLARAHRQLRAWLEPHTGELACTPTTRN